MKVWTHNLLNDSNTKDNSMINRRVSLFYQVFLECIPPYGLSVYLVECLCSMFSRHYCTGWSTDAHMDIGGGFWPLELVFNTSCTPFLWFLSNSTDLYFFVPTPSLLALRLTISILWYQYGYWGRVLTNQYSSAWKHTPQALYEVQRQTIWWNAFKK